MNTGITLSNYFSLTLTLPTAEKTLTLTAPNTNIPNEGYELGNFCWKNSFQKFIEKYSIITDLPNNHAFTYIY